MDIIIKINEIMPIEIMNKIYSYLPPHPLIDVLNEKKRHKLFYDDVNKLLLNTHYRNYYEETLMLYKFLFNKSLIKYILASKNMNKDEKGRIVTLYEKIKLGGCGGGILNYDPKIYFPFLGIKC
jgi:CRISPR-associated protein Cas8b1/Cst1 subtype I-B